MSPLYLDHNATTPTDPRVIDAMLPWFREPSNAGSRTHLYGQRAKEAVEHARRQIADAVGAQPEEILFTSGATESNNLALLGLAPHGQSTGRRHILSTAIEHKAVLEPLQELARRGFDVELAPVTSGGYVEPDEIKKRLRPHTLLVSVMHANNETGVLQPVHEIAELLADTPTFFHTDAAQTFGKEVEALRRLGCDLISISSHKIYGPQGIGALYVRRRGAQRLPLTPLMYGGGQERGLRPGTHPVPLVVGFGHAAELAAREHPQRRDHAARLKARLLADLRQVDHHINGDQARCLPHVLNVSFPGVDSEALMLALRDKLAISSGSACTSAADTASHVLRTMQLPPERIDSAVRISWTGGLRLIPADPILRALHSLMPSDLQGYDSTFTEPL